jgi:hypothetical protein
MLDLESYMKAIKSRGDNHRTLGLSSYPHGVIPYFKERTAIEFKWHHIRAGICGIPTWNQSLEDAGMRSNRWKGTTEHP